MRTCATRAFFFSAEDPDLLGGLCEGLSLKASRDEIPNS